MDVKDIISVVILVIIGLLSVGIFVRSIVTERRFNQEKFTTEQVSKLFTEAEADEKTSLKSNRYYQALEQTYNQINNAQLNNNK